MVGLKGLAAQLFAKQSLAKGMYYTQCSLSLRMEAKPSVFLLTIAAEFDPESEVPADDDNESQNGGPGSDSDASAPEDTQDTEHYVQVG